MRINKTIITVPAAVTAAVVKVTVVEAGKGTVKVLKPVGRQTLFVTDHAEMGTEKFGHLTVEGAKKVPGAKKTARATRAAKARTQVALMQHRINVADRREVRVLAKEQKRHNKAQAKINETVVEDDGTTEAVA